MFMYDATGVQETKVFDLIPDGKWLPFEIIEATEKLSSSGRPMVNCKCSVMVDPDYAGRWVWHSVVFIPAGERGDGMNVHFRKAIGVPWEGPTQVDAEEWIGKKFMGKVAIEEWQGKKRNKIALVSPLKAAAEGEEIPF